VSYLYVMHSPSRRIYKIGKADSVSERLRTFKTVDPDIRVVLTIQTDDPFGLESSMHRRFQRKRVWGDHEWFALNDGDLAWIKGNGAKVWRRWRVRLPLPRIRLRRLTRPIRRGLWWAVQRMVRVAIVLAFYGALGVGLILVMQRLWGIAVR